MTAGEPTRLWGGRFAGGPADAMAALSLSVTVTLLAGGIFFSLWKTRNLAGLKSGPQG